MLASRGVELSPDTLAGALLEAERDALIVGFIKAWAKASKRKS